MFFKAVVLDNYFVLSMTLVFIYQKEINFIIWMVISFVQLPQILSQFKLRNKFNAVFMVFPKICFVEPVHDPRLHFGFFVGLADTPLLFCLTEYKVIMA